MLEFTGMFSDYYVQYFVFSRTEARSLVLFICLMVELANDNLIIVQGSILNALLLNCFRLGGWDCLHRSMFHWVSDILTCTSLIVLCKRLLTLIGSWFNPSKQYRFWCPEELLYCKNSSRAPVLKGSSEVDVGPGKAMIMEIESVVIVDWQR